MMQRHRFIGYRMRVQIDGNDIGCDRHGRSLDGRGPARQPAKANAGPLQQSRPERADTQKNPPNGSHMSADFDIVDAIS
jgi:hypothetical protein